jgi:hypothetical protein
MLRKMDKQNYYLVIASHSPLPIDIQKSADFYFYQELNIVDNQKWSHGVAENNLLEIALLHLQYKGINWTYKLCYDVFIRDTEKLLEWQKNMRYDYVSCQWGENIISTNSFFASVSFILENIVFYKTIDEMFKVSRYLEACWEYDIKRKFLEGQIFTYPSKEEFFGRDNSMDVFSYSYSEIDFWYNREETKFYISNTGKDLECSLKIFDYFTGLCIYNDDRYKQNKDEVIWILPPFSGYVNDCKNGFQLVLTMKNGITTTKNYEIKHFEWRDPDYKKYRNFSHRSYYKNYAEGERVQEIWQKWKRKE